MEEFKLNSFGLQLFAEVEGGAGSDTGDQGDQNTGIGVGDDDGGSEPSVDPIAIPNKLGLNKDGDLQYIEDDDDGAEDEDQGDDDDGEGGEVEKTGETDKQTTDQGEGDGEQKPSFYSPEELFSIASTNIADLDPARIPPESLPLYRALVANQVKKPETQPSEQKPAEKVPTPEELAEQITEAAMESVVEELRTKGEEFDEYNMAHQRMLFRAEAKIERRLEESAAQRRSQDETRQKVYSKIESKAKELQKNAGADFADIDKLAQTHIHSMSYSKAAPIAAAIERLNNGQATEADIPVLEGYWEECRREHFAKKTGVSKEPKPVPPQTLKPGNDKETKEKINPREIGKMNQDERIEYYKRTGFADRIANLG